MNNSLVCIELDESSRYQEFSIVCAKHNKFLIFISMKFPGIIVNKIIFDSLESILCCSNVSQKV